MLTGEQVAIVKATIKGSAHDICVSGSGDAFVVSAVDDKTGYPFEVHDYALWVQGRQEAKLMAAWDEWTDPGDPADDDEPTADELEEWTGADGEEDEPEPRRCIACGAYLPVGDDHVMCRVCQYTV